MHNITRNLAAVRKRLKTIDLGREAAGAPEKEYFKYYGLDIPGARHHFGLLRSHKGDLAVHAFIPGKYRGTVVMVHGYLEHGAYFKHAVRRLLKDRYAVVIFDLPGHGLSSGSSATVRDFSQYAAALERVVRFSAKELKAPVHLIGHSMGCSAVVELLLTREPQEVGKVVLAAPLVHPSLWSLTKVAYRVLAPLTKKVPRMFPVHSSDKEFMVFTLFKDPLLRKEIPVSWVHSMLRWNEHLGGCPGSLKEMLILQGTRDTIVDGKYNVAYLQAKFPRARTRIIEGANHQLFNEAPVYRTKTLSAIVRYLAKRRD